MTSVEEHVKTQECSQCNKQYGHGTCVHIELYNVWVVTGICVQCESMQAPTAVTKRKVPRKVIANTVNTDTEVLHMQ